MANETNYAVNVRYLVDNRGGRQATAQLNDDVRKLDASTRSARDSFGLLGTAAAVAFGFAIHKAEDALIGFNSRVESSKISLAAMVQGFKGGEWSAATDNAARMYDEFQKFSVQTPVTTQDIMTFGKAVGSATFAAGGSIKDLTAITEQGVISAKAFGEESALASLQISEMLMGNVNSRMRFVKILLGMAHMEEEKFKQLSGEQRIKVVRGVLEGESMKNARDALGESFEGVSSTFKDKLQIAFGGAGAQLFGNVKAQFKEMNAWIDANQVKIDHMARSLSEGLSTGFGVVKDAISLMVAHADTFMTLGKIWLAVKIGGMVGGGVGGAGSWLAGAAGGMFGAGGFFQRDKFALTDGGKNYEWQKAGRGFQPVSGSNIAGNMPLVGASLAAGYALGTLVNDATGASRALANMALSRTDLAFERVTKASDSLTEAMERAAHAAPNQSAVQTNLSAAIERYHLLSAIASDAARAPMRRDREGNEFIGDVALSKIKELEAMGVGMDEITKAGGLRGFADAQRAMEESLTARRGSVSQTGDDAFEMGMVALTDYQRQTLDVQRAQQDLLTYINLSLSSGVPISPQTVIDILRKDTEDPEGKHKKMADKPNVNIHIARIEVQSDDPDRMAFGLVEFFRDAAKNPSSAVNALREG